MSRDVQDLELGALVGGLHERPVVQDSVDGHAAEARVLQQRLDPAARKMTLLVATDRALVQAVAAGREDVYPRGSGLSGGEAGRGLSAPREHGAVVLGDAVAREGGPVRAQRVEVEEGDAARREVRRDPAERGPELAGVAQV